MRYPLLALLLLLTACDARPYSGRCGDPPHGTAYRVLACQVMHDDAPSGGAWRWRCD